MPLPRWSGLGKGWRIASALASSGGFTPSVLTFDSLATKSGNAYTFTARRATNLSSAETRTISVAGSTAYPPAALASDFGGVFPTATATFAPGSATAAFTINANAAVQPE